MGNWLARLFAEVPARVCMVGLDGGGKTTVLYKLKFDEVVATIPTIGFNVDTVTVKNLTMTVWDVGGQHKIRALWHYYFENNDAVVFVLDSSDRERFPEARDELQSMMGEDRLRESCLLLLANKQDLPGAAGAAEVVQQMGLDKLQSRQLWHVQASCATSGDGIVEGFSWLADAVKRNRREKRRNSSNFY